MIIINVELFPHTNFHILFLSEVLGGGRTDSHSNSRHGRCWAQFTNVWVSSFHILELPYTNFYLFYSNRKCWKLVRLIHNTWSREGRTFYQYTRFIFLYTRNTSLIPIFTFLFQSEVLETPGVVAVHFSPI